MDKAYRKNLKKLIMESAKDACMIVDLIDGPHGVKYSIEQGGVIVEIKVEHNHKELSYE